MSVSADAGVGEAKPAATFGRLVDVAQVDSTGRLMTRLRREKSSRRNSFHSVTTTSASAPLAAS